MWHSMKINGFDYLTSLEIKPSNQLCVTLSNLTHVWVETVSRGEAILRFKKCNPKAKLSDVKIIEFIEELFLMDKDSPNVDLIISGDGLKLDISRTIIVKMSYYFTFTKLNEESVHIKIILPLLLVINELKYAQEELYKKLEAKDLHLKEFELEGCRITRKNVVTSIFRKEEFKQELKCDMEDRINFGLANASSIFVEGVNEVYPAFQNLVPPLQSNPCKSGLSIEEGNGSKIEVVADKPTILPIKRNGKEDQETLVCKRIKSTKKIIL